MLESKTRKEELEALKEYVKSSEPEVNRILRTGDRDDRVALLDSLFSNNEGRIKTLYRGLPNSFVKIKDGGYFEQGFLSTSQSLDCAFNFIPVHDSALFIITIPKDIRFINVNSLIECNNESEFILPHHTIYKLNSIEVFSNPTEIPNHSISDFERLHEGELYEKLLDYSKLTVYCFTVDNPQ